MIGKTKANALRKTAAHQVDWPDYAILAHAVCAQDETGCGWSGFLPEGAFRKDGLVHNSGTGDLVVPAVTNQICPNCGGTVFRTWTREFDRRPM